MYNALNIPESFKYRVQGLNSEHLHLKIHAVTTCSWSQAKLFSALLVPIFMAYSRNCMTEAKNDIQIFLSQAFPESPNLALIPAVALENTDERKPGHTGREDPLPWAIMVENLQKTDLETILYHQFWLSSKISFAAHPSDTFITKWVGNYLFYAKEDQQREVIATLQQTLVDKTSAIRKELDKLPLFLATSIINSINTRAYQVGRNKTKTHWAFYIESPHPNNIKQHHKWVDITTCTDWYHNNIGMGAHKKVPLTCHVCKGLDHSTMQCPL